MPVRLELVSDPSVKTLATRHELLLSVPLPVAPLPLLDNTDKTNPTLRATLVDTSSPLPLPTSSRRVRLPVDSDTPTRTSPEVVSGIPCIRTKADHQNPSLTPSRSTLEDPTAWSSTKRLASMSTDTNSRDRSNLKEGQ
jgi:hypothetical protein